MLGPIGYKHQLWPELYGFDIWLFYDKCLEFKSTDIMSRGLLSRTVFHFLDTVRDTARQGVCLKTFVIQMQRSPHRL